MNYNLQKHKNRDFYVSIVLFHTPNQGLTRHSIFQWLLWGKVIFKFVHDQDTFLRRSFLFFNCFANVFFWV